MVFHATNNNKYNCRAYQQQQQQNRWHHPLSPGLDSPLSSRSSSSRSYSFDNSSNAGRHRCYHRPCNKVPLSQYVALDCEMVGTTRRQQAAAHVVMVNWQGDKIYDEYVKPDQFVTDYRTFVSGVTAQDLEKYGRPLAVVRKEIRALLHDKILVGHALGNDLKCLNIKHPWHLQRDTARYGPFMQEARGKDGSILMQPRKLRHLASKILRREIQVPGKAHCPTEDAIAAMDLFKSQRHRWEKWVQSQQQEISHSQQSQQQEISRSQQSQQQEISRSQQSQQWQRQGISKSQQLQQLQMQFEQHQYIQQRFVQEISRSWQLQQLQMQFEQQRYLQQQFFRHHHPQRHQQSIRHHHPQRLQKHPSLT